MKQLFILILMMVFAGQALQAQIKNISAQEAAALLKQKKEIVVLDVRTQGEYAEGHLPNSKNMDVLQEAQFMEKIRQLDPKKTYLIYCRTGRRSLTAAEILAKNGFTHLLNMEGGIVAWKGVIVKPE